MIRKDIVNSTHEAGSVPVLRNARTSDLQTRFNGDCDDGRLPEPFVGIGSACFAADRVQSEDPDGDERFVDSQSCPGPWAKIRTGKMWAPPGVRHASIVDAPVVIMVFA
jgi:hypothetical protein